MTNIEKIKAEIEKRREDIKAYCLNPNHDKRYDVVPEQLAYILAFIDSLPDESKVDVTDFCKPIDPGIAQCIADNWWEMLGEEETPSKDLKDAAVRWEPKYGIQVSELIIHDIRDAFIAGAEWQKGQMTKDAEEGEIGYWNQTGLSIRLDQPLEKLGYDEDTKVEVIIKKKD